MDLKAQTLLVVSLFLFATFCTNGVNGGGGGKGKGGRGKGAHGGPVRLHPVATWRSDVPGRAYDPAVAANTARYAVRVLEDYSRTGRKGAGKGWKGAGKGGKGAGKGGKGAGKGGKGAGKGGKGAGKGGKGGDIPLDPIRARHRTQAHEFMEDGRADRRYFSFYYGATTEAQAARGPRNGVRVVVEADRRYRPTRRYWVTEHPRGGNGYQNWSRHETLLP